MNEGVQQDIYLVEDPFRIAERAFKPVLNNGGCNSGENIVPVETYNGPCPYIPSGIWVTKTLYCEDMDSACYEAMLNQGIRRSGRYFYQNCCPGCKACCLIKIDARRFQPSRSQRRSLKKNKDIVIRRSIPQLDRESFRLYQRYCAGRHHNLPDKEDFFRFLVVSPVRTECMKYYLKERLVGIGWIDILPNSLSSVYFAFDPEFRSRSLGVFSMLQEIALCRKLNKYWLHAGFWVKESPKMSYKIRYRPNLILSDGVWLDSNLESPAGSV